MKKNKVEKQKKHNYKIIIGLLLGLAIGSIGVYAATQIASSNVTYTNNNQETVQGALDDLYTKIKNPICKRATTLHSDGTHTFGNQTVTEGTLTSGDAFDCDVDGTGYNHRFYFVSYKYIGGSSGYEAYDTNIAVLIYYNNVSEGVADNITKYAYNSDDTNYNGPITAVQQLPKTSGPNAWSKLKNTKRTILNEIGGNYNIYNDTNYNLPGNGKETFDYSNYAARLLTTQEIEKACNITIGSKISGELEICQYLMENTKYSNSGYSYGYWLETPRSNQINIAWGIYGLSRRVDIDKVNATNNAGVRPVIEVSINDIKY